MLQTRKLGVLFFSQFLQAILWLLLSFFYWRNSVEQHNPLLILASFILAQLIIERISGPGTKRNTAAYFSWQRLMLNCVLPLLLLSLAFEGAKIFSQASFIIAAFSLLLFAWLSVGWSGLYDYNPLVLQLADLPLFGGWLALSWQYEILFPFVLFCIVLSFILNRAFKNRVYKISNIDYEGEEVVKLELQAQKPSNITYQPGQFVYVDFPLSSPAPLKGRLPLSVAAVSENHITLLARLKENQRFIHSVEKLRLGHPHGKLFDDLTNYPKAFFFAAGLGVSPYACLLSSQQALNYDIELHWFLREGDADILNKEEESWKENNKQLRVFRYTALTREQLGATINETLSCPSREYAIYMCGSLGFNRMVYHAALEREWSKKSLYYQFI